MGKLANTWRLAGISWSVLGTDKELLLLPALSGICTVVVAATFFIPLIVLRNGLSAGGSDLGLYVGLFAFYWVSYFVVTFFNTALIGAATIRMDGGDPTVRDGLRIAWQNVGRIIGWAAVAATVGIVLRILEERFELLGRLVAGLLGTAWSIATYFVVPILVYEQVGPLDALTRSAALFKRTWGEQFASTLSFGLLFFVLALPALLLCGVAVLLGPVALFVMVPIAVVYLLALGVVNAALHGVFVAALYRYARTGQASGQFTEGVLNSAWLPRSA